MSNELKVFLVGDATKLTSSLNKASSKLSAFGKSARQVGKDLSLKLTAPIGLAAGVAISSAAKFEKLQTTLKVLTGSAEKGAAAFENLVKFSAKTPFQLEELVRANNTMMGFGISAEDAAKHLQAIGDIAAVSGGDLQGITVAFSQVAAAGRLMGQDLLQLINNGVPIIDMLSSSMGVAKSEIKEMVSQGAVTFPVLLKAFQDATSEGGKFEGGMKTLSGTLSGLGSTLKDNLNIAFAELGKEIVEAFDLKGKAQNLIIFIGDLTQKFKNLSPETKKAILIISGLAAAIGPVLLVIGTLSSGLGLMATGFTGLISVLALVKGGFIALTTAMMANPFVLVGTAIVGLVAIFVSFVQKLEPAISKWQTFLNMVKSFGSPAKFAALQLKTKAENAKEAAAQAEKDKKATEELTKANNELLKSLQNINNESGNKSTSQRQTVGEVNQIAPGGAGLAKTSIDPITQMAMGAKNGNALMAEELSKSTQMLQADIDQRKSKIEQFKEISVAMGESVQNTFGMMGSSIAQSLGMGESALGTFAGTLVQTAMTSIGASLASTMGSGAEAAGNTAKAMGPIGAFVLPALLAGAAVAVKGAFSKVKAPQKFANGGIVSAPTMGLVGEYAGAKSNPEVIAPLDKLKGMIGDRGSQKVDVGGSFTLKGQDLVVALQRANTNRNRII